MGTCTAFVFLGEGILEKLEWYGFETEWFKSYFDYRCQVVKDKDGKLSKVKFTIRGAPQGKSLYPLKPVLSMQNYLKVIND